jgi:hypothetical protein
MKDIGEVMDQEYNQLEYSNIDYLVKYECLLQAFSELAKSMFLAHHET